MSDYSSPKGKEWQAPPAATTEDRRLAWAREATEEGMAWLKSQRGYSDGRKALDVIAGRDTTVTTASYRSRVNPNRLKRNVREVISALAKLRPIWGYQSDNKAYEPQAAMMNKVTRAWYLESFVDLRVYEALCWAAATGRGWLCPVYRRDMGGTGHGELECDVFGAPSVLPVQLPASNNFQRAYAVTILDEVPVFEAHARFPAYQHRIRPSQSKYWYANDNVRRSSQGNLLQRMFGRKRSDPSVPELSDLMAPIRKSYIIDLSINTTDKPIPMGEPGTSWAYTVPFVGQELKVGTDPKSGTILTRKATEDDARLYPRRRLIISTDECIPYDGPAFDWHGMFPGVSFTVDYWPWEPLGFSLVHDGYEINEAIKVIDRGNMDKISAQMRPSMAYDTNAVASKDARAFDPFKPDDRIGYDGSATEGRPFQQTLEPDTIKIAPESIALAERLEGHLDTQLGVRDVVALAKLRTVGSMDELEKIMEANGPIVELISRSMEPPMRDLGVMAKYLICQYYTTPRVMQIVGPDGVSKEVFDYDPSSLVPSHLPNENVETESPTDKMERAKVFADNLRFFILPHTLHEINQMTMKLGLVQLRKSGIWIDSQTIAEAWNIPNYGTIEGNTVIDRWQMEQEMQLRLMARMKAEAEGLGLTPPGGAGAGGAPPGAPKPGGGSPEGRPASFNAPPAIASKDNGTRSTITTSK